MPPKLVIVFKGGAPRPYPGYTFGYPSQIRKR
jgi:hypothetical protein